MSFVNILQVLIIQFTFLCKLLKHTGVRILLLFLSRSIILSLWPLIFYFWSLFMWLMFRSSSIDYFITSWLSRTGCIYVYRIISLLLWFFMSKFRTRAYIFLLNNERITNMPNIKLILKLCTHFSNVTKYLWLIKILNRNKKNVVKKRIYQKINNAISKIRHEMSIRVTEWGRR